jgi:xylan 1,4-beta-xylosidase
LPLWVWNYHDDDIRDAGNTVKITITDLPANTVTLTQYRIDEQHSNSYEAWKKMGSTQTPTSAQIEELQKAGQLQTMGKPIAIPVKSGRLSTEILLPRQGVALLRMSW